MNQRRHLTFVAAGSTILASLPLSTVFDTWSWLVEAILAVGVIMGVGVLVRSLRVPVWAPTIAQVGAFLLSLTWMFHSGHEFAGLIPTSSTFLHFNDLLLSAGTDMRDLGVPVQDREGLLFLSTLGIGSVAIVVDLCAVVLGRPALAGLPMLAIYSVPVAVHQDSVNFIPFALGAAGFLWLLVTDNVDRIRRFGRRFTGDGRDIDLWEPSPLAAAGRRLALVGVLIAIVVPVIVPGSNTGLLDRFGSDIGTGSGPGFGAGGAGVDLFAVLKGTLNQDRTFDMVKVRTDEANPYYLRFGVADQLTPDGFRNRTPGGGQSTTAGMPPVMAASQPGVTSRSYRAQVQVVALDMRMLPIYLQPTRTEKLDSSWLYDRTNQVVYSRRNQARGKSYTFDYARLEYSPEALRTARPLDDGDPIQRTYTDVPKVAEVEKVVREITAGKQTQYDKVRAIHAYFSTANGFQYSLKTQDGTSGSAIVDFLHNRQGFCEQYSAAMAWLVRSAGIPARVAFGFSRGGKSGDTWTMTNRNLHAWTEVYFDRYGWIPFDATPASFVGGVDSAWAPDPNKKEDAGGNSPNGNLPGGPPVDSSGSAGPATNLPNQRGELPEGTGQAPPAPAWPLWTLAGVLVALLLAASPAVWRARLRRRRWPDAVRGPAPVNVTVAPGSRDVTVTDDSAAVRARLRAHAAWDELIDTMIDYRLPVDDAATPRMTAERLVTESALTGAAATGARQLGHAEERARYARSPLHGDDLAGSLRAVRGAIAGRVSWRTRVRAVVAPASVLDRWQVAVTRTSGQVTETVGRWADTVSRAASLRRWLRLRRS